MSYIVFTDLDGLPLEDGMIFVGGAPDARDNPISVYWDEALTIPAAQPIRTLAGYPAYQGGPGQLYITPSQCLVTVLDKNGVTVISNAQGRPSISAADISATTSGKGAALVGFKQPYSGAVATTVQKKLEQVVSAKDFGALGDGATDDTVAIQAALNSGARSVYLPAGVYLITSLTMPNVFNFVLHGDGPASTLKMSNAAGDAAIKWPRSATVYNQQTLRNFGILGTEGVQHCVDLRGSGGTSCESIYITDVPPGKAGFYTNGLNGVYDHDARFLNIQIYYGGVAGGFAGIWLGSLSADTQIQSFNMNGGFEVDYCIYADNGAQSIQISDSHPYNAKINVMRLAGNNGGLGCSNVCFDNAEADIIVINSSSNCHFSGCRVQAARSGFYGVKLTGTGIGHSFIDTLFDGQFGTISAIYAESGMTDVLVFGGQLPGNFNYTTPFDLRGARSDARGIAGHFPFGLQWSHAGVQNIDQAQNTVQYLGSGSAANEQNASYVVPQDAQLANIYIAVNTTPAAGQTYTFQARRDGADIGSPLVLSNGQVSGTITLNADFSKYGRLTIRSTFSATSGGTAVRWSAEFRA